MTETTDLNTIARGLNISRFAKNRIALKFYMQGAGYTEGLKAMAFAEHYHKGFRKDGTTPEFMHQVEIALYIITLRGIPDEERAIIGALLHDVREDYDVEYDTIASYFGADIANDNKLLTKRFKGVGIDKKTYFTNMQQSPYAVLIKGADRVNNMQSMVGVFTPTKMESYTTEVSEYFMPMLKSAMGKHPAFMLAYTNVRVMLRNQSQLIAAVLAK